MENNNEIEEMEDAFRENKFYFSPSSFNRLSKSPREFYKRYVLKENEDEDKKYFIFGRLLHCLLLEPETFNDQFVLSSDDLPSDNVISILKALFELEVSPESILEDFGKEILEEMESRSFHNNVKDVDKKLAKVINDKGYSYFEFLKQSLTKTIVDLEMYDKVLLAMDEVKKNKFILNLICYEEKKGVDVYNELELKSEFHGTFGLKGICDNLVIDHNKKKVFINDFKTTSRYLIDFEDSLHKYGYANQAAIYYMILVDELDGIEGYDFEFNFVVFDRDSNLYAFRVTEETMQAWKNDVLGKLIDFKYHFDTMDFTLPIDFITNTKEL